MTIIEPPNEEDYENFSDYREAFHKFWNDKRDLAVRRVKEILETHNIKIDISGCGCCGSPTVSFVYNDQTICEDVDDFKINMIEATE